MLDGFLHICILKYMKEKKLYEIPNDSPLRVWVGREEREDEATFHHIDGMFSLCRTSDGQPFHLHATTPVVLKDGRYEIVNNPK